MMTIRGIWSGPQFKMLMLLTVTVVLALVVPSNEEPYGGGGGYFGAETRCPRLCSCTGTTVDCSHRGLTQVPRKIPTETDRLDLQGNNISVIYESDLQGLAKLRILLEFRSLVRTYGTDLAFTSMIMADSFCKSEKARLNEFTTNNDDTPLIAQFAANNTIDFLSASEMVYPYVDGVDLNCGCPQRWAMAEGYGSALLKTPELIADMLGTVRRNMPSSFSVSVKVRLLSSTNQKQTIDLCRQLEATGITFLTVHGRTAPEMTKVPVHREALQEIKQSIGIPMVANGDIFTLDDAEKMYLQTRCDGIMAARGILSNPALFSGLKSTPVECVKRWLNICQHADTDITYQCMHHHFSFMTESLLSKRLRLQLNTLSKEKQNVFDFIRTHLPLDSVVDDMFVQDYPEKVICSYNDQTYRRRTAEHGVKTNGTVADGCAYDPEASDGNFFRSKRAELDESQPLDDVAEEVDGVGFMDGGSLLFDE